MFLFQLIRGKQKYPEVTVARPCWLIRVCGPHFESHWCRIFSLYATNI